MNFDVDVSGEDIFNKDYTICIANNDNLIKGFKFDEQIIRIIKARHGNCLYKYGTSKKEKSLFKIRVYCIIIHYLFMAIKKPSNMSLSICKDFSGHDHDIDSNLRYFLEKLQGIKIDLIKHVKLDKNSFAHKYAFLMRNDTKNKSTKGHHESVATLACPSRLYEANSLAIGTYFII